LRIKSERLLEQFLLGRSLHEPLEDAHSCAFARWLRNLSPPQLRLMGIDGQGPRWRATLALHERLHEGMDELLQLARHSGHPAALEHMPGLQVLREQLLLALQGFLPQSVPRTTAAD